MKNKLFYFIGVLIICTAFILPTTHPANSLCVDYRDAYVGTYFCSSYSVINRFKEGPISLNDTISIQVSKDAIDSVLKIGIGVNSFLFKLKSGVLYNYPDETAHLNGKFYSTDSILVNIMSRASMLSLTGKKIN